MRRIGWTLLVMSLLVLLAGCGLGIDPNQQGVSLNDALSTPTVAPTMPPIIALQLPSQPTPTPTPTALPRPAPPVNNGGGSDGGGSAPNPTPSGASQLEQQLFTLINSGRAAQGLYPYTLNATLSSGARQHSVVMSGSCGMSHQCPGEPAPCTRETNEGVSWTSCGENVGYSSPNPTDWAGVQGIERDMLNEQPPDDGHRLNLLSSSFHRVGIGIVIGSNGLVWITEDFAS